MKRGFKRLLLVICCLAIVFACGCGLLEQRLTVLELEPEEPAGTEELQLGRYWYGYWYITDTEEKWRDLDGYSWDCCGELSSIGEEYSLLLWDEDMPKDYYLAKIHFQHSDGGYYCSGGEFLDVNLARGAVTIKLEEDSGALFRLSGSYSDDSTGSFYYVVYLRPWGELWPSGQSRPYFYESWYLPRIEAGEDPPDVMEPYEYK